jgi:hypothetical protein
MPKINRALPADGMALINQSLKIFKAPHELQNVTLDGFRSPKGKGRLRGKKAAATQVTS